LFILTRWTLADPELVELVEMDIRELLAKNGFDENAPIIKGSATKGPRRRVKKTKIQSWSWSKRWMITFLIQSAILTNHF
jgi:translation elongation factor EF-Tu-like GTPase